MNHLGTILYVHGMGGGKDSRIPAILRERFSCLGGPDVVVRTYDFDPEVAQEQLAAWVKELSPSLLVGESLGANHALALSRSVFVSGITAAALPIVLVSPALGAPAIFHRFAFLALVPGVGRYLEWKFKPRQGERQKLSFKYRTLRKWGSVEKGVIEAIKDDESRLFAFFGKKDHYRKSGIVSLSKWIHLCGEGKHMEYDGTHFMEEEFVKTLLVGKILEMLDQEGRHQVGNKAEL